MRLFATEATAQWSTNPDLNNAICTAGGQYYPTIVSDGAGGAIITWEDRRTGFRDIYAQRINAAGVVQWTIDGVAICTSTGDQETPTIVSDDAGGAIITWQDSRPVGTSSDIYAQRINVSGVVQWTTNGVAISTAADNQSLPTIVNDGAGGAIITSHDSRSGIHHIYAQQVNANGQLGVVTGVQHNAGALPESFRLDQNFPNPFNPATTISFSIPSRSSVSLKVVDALGREVSVLLSEELPGGTYSRQWNAAGLASGVYYYQLRADRFLQTNKLVLLK